jgi:hypothetical protein
MFAPSYEQGAHVVSELAALEQTNNFTLHSLCRRVNGPERVHIPHSNGT